MRRIFSVLLAALLLLPLAACGDNDPDVSLKTYFDNKNGVTPAPTDEAPADGDGTVQTVDKNQPVYEADGSIVITITCTGDFTIGSNAKSSGKSIFEKELAKQDGDVNFPLRNFKDILEKDDLTLINFEGTLTTGKINPDRKGNDFLFSAPPEYVSMLNYGSVEAVSLENNHVMDFGESGLQDTKDALTGAGVVYSCEDEAGIFSVKSVNIGMLAYQTFGGRHDEIKARLQSDIDALRGDGCEIVIVSFHWGAEKEYSPNDNCQALGKAAIDAGADLVVGHHSHRMNPIEEYKGKYICYSLGNFSFAGHNKPDDMSTIVFQTKFRVKDGTATPDGFIIIPARISSRTDYNDMCPTPYTKEENIEAVLKTLKENGKKLANPVAEYPLSWSKE